MVYADVSVTAYEVADALMPVTAVPSTPSRIGTRVKLATGVKNVSTFVQDTVIVVSAVAEALTADGAVAADRVSADEAEDVEEPAELIAVTV